MGVSSCHPSLREALCWVPGSPFDICKETLELSILGPSLFLPLAAGLASPHCPTESYLNWPQSQAEVGVRMGGVW